MNTVSKSQLILKLLTLACFSIVVLFFFRFYSMLRPATCGAFYKEWLSGGIVLSLCYLNYFVLYPRLYAHRRFLAYILATIMSVIMATSIEVMLVYPQICDFVNRVNDLSLQEYFTIMTVLIFLRDACFVVFFFLFNLLETAYKENKDVIVLLQNTNELMVVRTEDKENALVTVRLADIAYCQQNENYAYLYLADGTKVYRNCSLKSLYEQLTPSRVVRISRKVIVFYRHIVSYDNCSVYVNVSNNDTPIGLEITNTFRQQALQLLNKHCLAANNQQAKPISEVTIMDEVQGDYRSQQEEDDSVQANGLSEGDPQIAQQVLAFIREHPGCKNPDISRLFRVSQSTVNRILAQLKKEGLIEYMGSKKTGGYKVVEG